jgi:hypothetical protein
VAADFSQERQEAKNRYANMVDKGFDRIAEAIPEMLTRFCNID